MQRVSAARLQAQHRPQSAAAGDARRHPAPAAKLPLFHGMHVELLAGAAGMIICSVFMLSPSSPPTPLPVALGMLFTNGVCPVLLALAPAFYRHHRTAVVLLARVAFMHGTLHVWHEERPWQRGSMGWPALLLTLAYSSRALVACWGALGWQLPLPWHVVVTGLHVNLAGWRLAPAVCGAAGALRGNSSKLQTLALLLDWWVSTCLQSRCMSWEARPSSCPPLEPAWR